MPNKVRRWIIAHDLHYPLVAWDAWKAMLELIKDIKPEGFLFGGDQLDNTEISHHNSNKPFYKERRSYLRNQENFDEEILTPLEKLLPRGCEKVWLTGNHDFWEFEFVETHPELEGLIDRPTALKLEERGWE